ncbi:MAG: glycine C-acetyltransferase [Bacillota bacterium]|nr:glycine C-acetyltransferase [Bacillota bacterium]
MSIHDLKFLEEKVEQLKKDGVFRILPVLEGHNASTIVLDGKEMVNLSSNNYLGLATNPKLKEAAKQAVDKYGVGAGAVRTIIGNMDIHEELEKKLAEFKHTERVFLYQSGYDCNVGTIQAIVEKGDLVISDELNHASIIDGIRMTKADKAIFKHSDMEDLERVLKENHGKYKTMLIITDGVFSMDGDLAKLPEIVDLAEKYDALTYVDDAHGSGVMGSHGRGTVDHFGLHDRVDFVIGTLSKAIGVKGGYVACNEAAYQWLNHRARPVLFSTTLSPADTAACMASIDLLMETDELQKKLWDNAKYFKEKLGTLGFNTGHSETPITPVIIGDEAQTMEFSKKLREYGVFGSAIVFPTVPKGTGRVRCMISAAHSKEELDKAVAAFEQAGKDMGII